MSENLSDLRTAFLISGGGTTAEAAIKACQSGEIEDIDPVVVISNRPYADGIRKAKELGIPTAIVERKGVTFEEFGDNLYEVLQNYNVDFISQNGWLPTTPPNIIEKYLIVNQHPGKITGGTGLDFGGRGMYGSRVTAATLIYEWIIGQPNPFTESTIHYVNGQIDKGLLIRVASLKIPSLAEPVTIADFQTENALRKLLIDTTVNVQNLLLPIEHQNLIETLKMFGTGSEIKGWSRNPEDIVPQQMIEILSAAKELGIEIFPNG